MTAVAKSDTPPVAGQAETVGDWLTGRTKKIRHGIIPILEELKRLVDTHCYAFLLIDGPQGVGKTRYLEPIFREAMEQMFGFAPETVCTDIALLAREERQALPPEQYHDLWRWYRFGKLTDIVRSLMAAQKEKRPSVTVTDWYNRAKGGIYDPKPLSLAVKPVIVLEGIGALSDQVIKELKNQGAPFTSVLFNAPAELRFRGLLAVRTYRSAKEQLKLMKLVDASYWDHYPELLRHARYYAFLAPNGLQVSKHSGGLLGETSTPLAKV